MEPCGHAENLRLYPKSKVKPIEGFMQINDMT